LVAGCFSSGANDSVKVPTASLSNLSASRAVVTSAVTTLARGTASATFDGAEALKGSRITRLEMFGSGTFDLMGQRADLSLSVSGFSGTSDVSETERYVDGILYLDIPAFDPQVVGQPQWLSVPLSSAGTDPGRVFGGAEADLGGYLRLLEAPGNQILDLGRQSIDGQSLNEYSVILEPARIDHDGAVSGAVRVSARTERQLADWLALQNNLNPTVVDIWVDTHCLIHQVFVASDDRVQFDGIAVDDLRTTVIDLSDFGLATSIAAPPAGQVVTFEKFDKSLGKAAS
jgi:hypothetical protein